MKKFCKLHDGRHIPARKTKPAHGTILAINLASALVVFCHGLSWAQEVAPTQMIQPPSLQLTDENFVNIAAGEVSITLEDVSIGQGALSLSHTIGTHSSDFVNYESIWGPADKFHGGLKKKHFRSLGVSGYPDDLYVATYFDFEGSLDFEINGDGTFTPLNDPAYSLVHSNGVYTVTKQNGTVVEIPGTLDLLQSTSHFTKTAAWNKITYPNGFIINVVRQSNSIGSPIHSVTTNTGLQLKYVYDIGYRHLPANKDKLITGPTNNMKKDGLEWSSVTAASVVAVNRGVDFCADTGSCQFTQTWPAATYHWPDGMPKAAYVEDTVFSVTDAAGRVTEYHHTPFDVEKGRHGGSTQTSFTTRLSKVQLAGQTTESLSYSYQNIFDPSPLPAWTFYRKNIGPATLTGANNKGLATSYDVAANGISAAQGNYVWQHKSTSSRRPNQLYLVNTEFHVPTQAQLWHQNVTWYWHGKTSINPPLAPIINRIKTVQHKRTGGESEYEYDTRGNITKVWGIALSQAGYPSSCSNPKTCNQPDWVKDNRSSVTHYTYHAPSGMVSTVTLPADAQGQYARTRYGYQQKYAWYKNSAGTLTQAATPIWLLTSEKTCRVGNTRSDNTGCLTTGAEIITTYHYGTEDGSKANNLWVSGMTVTADGESRTTCYTYDRFGNRLSETAPKANLTSCP